jgi:serine/threonine-protein kinase
MEWVEGMDLGSLVKAYREHGEHIPWPLVVAASIGTLRGLGAAHERRRSDGTPAPIVHRDVSPHNILVGTNGVVKLTDFGLARARDRVFSLTAPGTVKGKLSYLSPEVAMGGQATPLSDLFAMGAVIWEALVGERLFDGRSDLEVFKQIRQCLVRPLAPARPDVPQELIAVINGALTKEPDRRFGSASAMAFMLSEVLKLAPPGADPAGALGQAVVTARQRLGVKRNPLDGDHVPTWKWQGSPATPPVSHASATSPAKILSEKGKVETAGGLVGHEAEAVDIDLEFSKPDLTVEPVPLTPKKPPPK